MAGRHFVPKKVRDACFTPLCAITGDALNPYDHKKMVTAYEGHTQVNNKQLSPDTGQICHLHMQDLLTTFKLL